MRTPILASLALMALAVTASAGEPMKVTIKKVNPDPVDYPKSPIVDVEIERLTGKLSVWVIRNDDGAIIHKYPAPAGERWSTPIGVRERTNDPLPARAKGVNPQFQFTVAIVNLDQIVEASIPFSVSVSPKGWPTSNVGFESKWWPSTAYIMGGQLSEVSMPLSQERVFKVANLSEPFTLAKHMTIIDAGKWLSPEEVVQWQPRTGEEASVLYILEPHGGIRVSQIMVGTTALSLFAGKFWPIGARFQIGVLKAKRPTKDGQIVIDVTTPSGASAWRVTKTTEILPHVPITRPIESIQNGTLVAVSPTAAATSVLTAQRIILLEDRSGTP